jgi:formylglycine-generating enzyme required for sulfatase activity
MKRTVTLWLALMSASAVYGQMQHVNVPEPPGEGGLNSNSLSRGSFGGGQHPAEPEMIFVQGGTFWMGCSQEQLSSSEVDESPLHSVTVGNFYIGKYEITQEQWKLIMGNNPSEFKDDNLPIEMVSWNDVQEFLARLNAATGKHYRLPTEAEWEYAARGGVKSVGYKYSGSHNLYDVGWFADNSGGKSHAVGTKLPNELGLYDMSGNVWEWCIDWYGPYPASAQYDPMGADSDLNRVSRGGSWEFDARHCRVANRGGGNPGSRYRYLGFRVVLP